MKKSYISPEMELVLFESTKSMMDDLSDTVTDVFGDMMRSSYSFDMWVNDLPDGYIIDDSELENFKQ